MSTPPSSSLSRALISRILFGVTSIGAAIGVVYLVYIRQKNKDPPRPPSGDPTTATSTSSALANRKKKRMGSGERNRVTFSDQNQIICTDDANSASHHKDEIELDGNNLANEIAAADDAVVSNAKNEAILQAQQQEVSANNKTESLSSTVSPKNNQETLDKSGAAAPSPVKQVKEQVKEEIIKPQLQQSTNVSTTNGNHFAQHGLTAETDYDRTGITRELQISKDHVPGLIGRKGANIRAIQQDSNTLITFRDETLDNGDRICQIRGQPQDVTIAESLIEKHILGQPVLTSITMHVPHSSVGRIIGKGGESIRGIQDLSKAKVNVDTGNQFHNRGGSDSVRMVTVTLRGTEEQIDFARQMITEKVEEEKALRRNIDVITQNRAPRGPPSSSGSSSSLPLSPPPAVSASSANNSSSNGNHFIQGFRTGVLEVFVSCAYHPNDFWIQVMGRESILLDKLTEQMTEFYGQTHPEGRMLSVGEIIAAPFDVDGKMYRGKILKVDDATQSVEVCYLDYGDKRVINQAAVRTMHPEFLKIRFQALQATLNLGCVGERWSDEAIVAFCDLTYCAQWQPLTAKIRETLLKDDSYGQGVVWVELLDKDLNIGNSLISRGLAAPTPLPNTDAATNVLSSAPYFDNSSSLNNLSSTTSSSSSAPFNNSNKKLSYASVVAKEVEEGGGGGSGDQDGSNITKMVEDGPWGDDNINGN